MKRYSVNKYFKTEYGELQEFDIRIEENLEGQWVSYEDVSAIMGNYKKHNDALALDLQKAHGMLDAEVKMARALQKVLEDRDAKQGGASKQSIKPTFCDYVIGKHGSYPPCREPGTPYDVTMQALADCFAEWVEL